MAIQQHQHHPQSRCQRQWSRLEGFCTAIFVLSIFNLYSTGTNILTSSHFNNEMMPSSDEVDGSQEEYHNPHDHQQLLQNHRTRDYSYNDNEGSDDHQYFDGSASSTVQRRNRLVTVVGLESSGTTFVATTIAKALGYTKTNSKDLFHNMLTIEIPSTSANDDFTTTTPPRTTTWVQHVSLPSGFFREHQEGFERRFELPPTVPVIVPDECKIPGRYPYQPLQAVEVRSPQNIVASGSRNVRSSSSGNRMKRPAYTKTCREVLHMDYLMEYPKRYFVNLTSHVRWYQDRHVDATVVVVVRDQSLHFRGILKTHCTNATAAQEQFLHGRYLIEEAMTQLQQPHRQRPIRDPYHQTNEQGEVELQQFTNYDHNELIVVSYETLMTLQEAYLFDLYEQLGMLDATYIPEFVDGNAKYVSLSETST